MGALACVSVYSRNVRTCIKMYWERNAIRIVRRVRRMLNLIQCDTCLCVCVRCLLVYLCVISLALSLCASHSVFWFVRSSFWQLSSSCSLTLRKVLFPSLSLSVVLLCSFEEHRDFSNINICQRISMLCVAHQTAFRLSSLFPLASFVNIYTLMRREDHMVCLLKAAPLCLLCLHAFVSKQRIICNFSVCIGNTLFWGLFVFLELQTGRQRV